MYGLLHVPRGNFGLGSGPHYQYSHWYSLLKIGSTQQRDHTMYRGRVMSAITLWLGAQFENIAGMNHGNRRATRVSSSRDPDDDTWTNATVSKEYFLLFFARVHFVRCDSNYFILKKDLQMQAITRTAQLDLFRICKKSEKCCKFCKYSIWATKSGNPGFCTELGHSGHKAGALGYGRSG